MPKKLRIVLRGLELRHHLVLDGLCQRLLALLREAQLEADARAREQEEGDGDVGIAVVGAQDRGEGVDPVEGGKEVAVLTDA